MRLSWSIAVVAGLIGVLAPASAAQERDVRAELTQRGAPAAFADAMAHQVALAREADLPAGPVVDKALEGWAKHVPAPRVVMALEQVRERLEAGRRAAIAAGLARPPDAVVAGAAEALARGLGAEDIGRVVTAAWEPEAAGAGLTVAASLHAQGLERRAAVQAVVAAYGRTDSPAQLFELPSALANLTSHGVRMGDVARQIMEGGGLPLPPMAGAGPGGGRPGGIPPGPGKQQGTGKRGRQ
jgi:hypothetical protein